MEHDIKAHLWHIIWN